MMRCYQIALAVTLSALAGCTHTPVTAPTSTSAITSTNAQATRTRDVTFHVSDLSISNAPALCALPGAVVTITTREGGQTGIASGPRATVTFTVPYETTTVRVQATADGYQDYDHQSFYAERVGNFIDMVRR